MVGRSTGAVLRGALGRSRGAGVLRVGALLLAVVVAFAWWFRPPGESAYPRGNLPFVTGASGGVYEQYAQELEPFIERDLPGVRVRLRASAGSVENVHLVATGKSSLTIAAADAVADYHGTGHERLRACARLYDDYVLLIVPARSAVRSAGGLRGLRVGVGQPGSGVNLLTTRLLKAAGLDSRDDIDAVPVGINEAPEMLRRGKIDAFFWSGGAPTTSISALTSQLDVRLVPLGDLVKPLRAQFGGSDAARSYYRQAVLPPEAYPAAHTGEGEAVSTIAVANLLVTTDRADDGLVERLTKAVIDNRDRIGRKVHPAQYVDLRTAIYTDPLRLHQGAERYYRSVKP